MVWVKLIGGNMMSQADEILQYLEKGNTITPLEALEKFKCFRLAARIHDLRRIGIPIVERDVQKNGKRYAEYRLAVAYG
jgi:hypothetical protein